MKSTQEIQHIKEELEKKERLKEAAAKRKEKIADKEAKERIQAKIAADKEERRLKAEKAKAEREGRVIAEAPVAAPPPQKHLQPPKLVYVYKQRTAILWRPSRPRRRFSR